jgi:rare lipoprotein A (peptidoglycan hydrolase)
MGARTFRSMARDALGEGYDPMPMPRLIGISFALVTSACAVARTDTNASHPAVSTRVSSRKAEMSTRGSFGSPYGKTDNHLDTAPSLDQTKRSGLSLQVAAGACPDASDLCCSQTQATANSQFGKAAWYDLVGRETASGEFLDTVTATAANRSLPLGSFAKVTDLDNGRSVIVKINDRGPFTRGRIIDLSPRAAEVLHMKVAGVADVVIQPVEYQVDPQVEIFEIPGSEVAR